MARKIHKWEAETDPPSVHDSKEGAVAAELAAFLGDKGASGAGGEGSGVAFGIAREMVAKPEAVIAILAQLTPIATLRDASETAK